MIGRALPSLIGIFGLVLALGAQPARTSDGLAAREETPVFADAEVSLGRSGPELPALALADGTAFFYPLTFGWMQAEREFLPAFVPAAPQPGRRVKSRDSLVYTEEGKDSAQLEEETSLFHFGGEVGYVYGRYSGKQSGSIQQGYFLTEMGNDKFRLTVGASFTEDEGRRRVRRR